VDENRSLDHYNILTGLMERRGYEHYEISNFALPGGISKHNSGYWRGEKYLGFGPSAHSYNGSTRKWNMSKNSSYIRGIAKGHKVYDEEFLNDISRLHDYLMTSMRTMWGIDLNYLRNEWGQTSYRHVLDKAEPFMQSGKILNVEGKMMLTREGMFIADYIIGELFM
jgi:oxygen-independent coproporphyrinogen-3 oxidase